MAFYFDRLGLRGMLNEVIEDSQKSKVPALFETITDVPKNSLPAKELDFLDDGEIEKADNAIDYFDIADLSEDSSDNDLSKVTNELKNSTCSDSLNEKNVSVKEEVSPEVDKVLMPPPTKPIRPCALTSAGTNTSTDLTKDSKGPAMDVDPVPVSEKTVERKLDTPLADMLPSKYANVDVRELFPDFRPDKVLRFSRLFGPGKPSSLPQIWRHVKKRKRKRKQSRDCVKSIHGSDSPSESEEPIKRGFGFYKTLEVLPSQCLSDDEDKLLCIYRNEDVDQNGPDNGINGESKPKIADWRYGPAQIWYDMLDVPDSGEGFNYGYKLKCDGKYQENKSKNFGGARSVGHLRDGKFMSEESYLMLSQVHWEENVVWDGNEIKSKTLQILDSKMNAAGWLPSSGSRAFTPTGKSLPVPAITSAPGKISTNTASLNKQKIVSK